MGGLITYGLCGEVFLFNAAGEGKKLKGPKFNIKGVLRPPAVVRSVACRVLLWSRYTQAQTHRRTFDSSQPPLPSAAAPSEWLI